MISIEGLVGAYLIAGMAHILELLRNAFILEGDHGKIMRRGILRAPVWLFLGVILAWPIAVWRRKEWKRRIGPELISFVIAAYLLGP